MPHVSPKPLQAAIAKQLYALFVSTLTDWHVSRTRQQHAFQELLTPTEKIMLGKRLVAVSLLSQGASPHQVGRKLHLSPTTTFKLSNGLENGRFTHTEKICSAVRKGPLRRYIEALIAPPPRYGTGLASVLMKER